MFVDFTMDKIKTEKDSKTTNRRKDIVLKEIQIIDDEDRINIAKPPRDFLTMQHVNSAEDKENGLDAIFTDEAQEAPVFESSSPSENHNFDHRSVDYIQDDDGLMYRRDPRIVQHFGKDYSPDMISEIPIDIFLENGAIINADSVIKGKNNH